MNKFTPLIAAVSLPLFFATSSLKADVLQVQGTFSLPVSASAGTTGDTDPRLEYDTEVLTPYSTIRVPQFNPSLGTLESVSGLLTLNILTSFSTNITFGRFGGNTVAYFESDVGGFTWVSQASTPIGGTASPSGTTTTPPTNETWTFVISPTTGYEGFGDMIFGVATDTFAAAEEITEPDFDPNFLISGLVSGNISMTYTYTPADNDSNSTSAVTPQTVPEPASLSLVVAGVSMISSRKKKR